MPSWLARLLAVGVAVGLVAGAFVIRGVISDDGAVRAGVGSGGSSDGDRAVLCDADLGDEVCDAVADGDDVGEVMVVTLDEVLAMDPTALDRFDAWLTFDPAPAMLDVARHENALPALTSADATVEVVSSPLVLLTLDASPLECSADQIADWECLTADVNPAVAIPSTSTSLGSVAVGAAGAGIVGSTDFGISTVQGEKGESLREIVADSPAAAGATSSAQAAAMYDPGKASGAITVDAVGSTAAATPRGRGRGLATIAIEPSVTIGVVLAGLGPGGADAVADLTDTVLGDDVTDALADAGWDGPPSTSDGLPDPDVIYALREETG